MKMNDGYQYWELNTRFGKMMAGFDKEGILRELLFSESEEGSLQTKIEGEEKIPGYVIKLRKELDEYESGQRVNFETVFHADGTPFAQLVWEELLKITYGKTISYGELAKIVAKRLNKEKMSAQAIGQAVGSNPIAILIPCHRVIGAKGQLTGYAGGIERKVALLNIENNHKTERI